MGRSVKTFNYKKGKQNRRVPNHDRYINRDKDRIYPERLNYAYAVYDFICCAVDARRQGFEEVIIDFSNLQPNEKAHYPNLIVPMAAFIDNMKNHETNVSFRIEGDDVVNIEHTGLIEPLVAEKIDNYPRALNKVWCFESSDDVSKIVTKYMDDIYQEDTFPSSDFLNWLEWCLNEVMDNVIQHSNTEAGFVMGQVHSSNKTVAFCVADAGRGIYKSFLESAMSFPRSPKDALEMALREGCTRDPSIGQGNGLWGLHEIAAKTEGRLRLGSSGFMFYVDKKANFVGYPYLNESKGGTVVDFTFDYSKPIDLTDVLGGHKPDSIKTYSVLNTHGDQIKYPLSGYKSGFGTRQSGIKMRNEVVNYLLGAPSIELDFTNINIISSSFADEFIGKLCLEMGPIDFFSRVSIVNVNNTIKVIINKAIMQRIGQEIV